MVADQGRPSRPTSLVRASAELPRLGMFEGRRVPFWSLEEWDARSVTHGLSLAQLECLASFGVLAPTSHNTVPQRFKLLPESSSMEIFVDRNFVLPESDPKGRQAAVSIGCVVTNIELAASVFGRATKVRVLPMSHDALHPAPSTQASSEHDRYVPVVELGFEAARPSLDADWLDTMSQHKVVRAEYDASVTLPPELVTRVEQVVEELLPAPLALKAHILSGAFALRAIGKFQEQADRFVLENPRFARELGAWLLPNSETDCPTAMRGSEFGFDDAFSEQVHSGLLGRTRLLPDQIAAFAKGGKGGLESSSAVVILTTDTDDVSRRVAAGRACHRISLELQRAGFASAYHAALTEVEWVARMFSATLLRSTRRPMAVLRVGRPKRAPDSARLPAARPSLAKLVLS